MKFLEVDTLDVLNAAFRWETAECPLNGRIEAYSCKSAGADKRLFKQLENKYNPPPDLLTASSISPHAAHLDDLQVISPFGRLDEATPRKTFFYLLATLNAAFPEHDFSDIRPGQFSKQHSLELVINSVNTTLFNLGNAAIVNRYRMWDILDDLVQLTDCDVYSYHPDLDEDPMSDEDGYLWSMNYFFFNRKLKRMVYFFVKNQSLVSALTENDEDSEGYAYEDDDDMLDSAPTATTSG